MHYIRFLRTPRLQIDQHHGNVHLTTVITLTTDLGETFYPHDIELVATLCNVEDDNGETFARKKVLWPAGARSLTISFDFSEQDVHWPACLHVAPKSPLSLAPTLGAEESGFLPPIVEIWSGPMDARQSGTLESGTRVERKFLSVSSERSVSLLEEAGDSIARHLWDGSQALAQHLDDTIALQTQTASQLPFLERVLVSATYRKLNVLELGCGVGTVGISLAQSVPDVDVLLTDLPEISDLVEANIARMKSAMSSKVSFAALDWESENPPAFLHTRSNDLIIVSECTYNVDTLQALVNTLLVLTERSPKALIVVATKTRHESEAVFFEMMETAGFVEDGRVHVNLPGIPGDGYADRATEVGLYVFHGKGHRLRLSPRGSEREVRRMKREEPRGRQREVLRRTSSSAT